MELGPRLTWVMALLLGAAVSHADLSGTAEDEYRRLREGRYSTRALPVPNGGLAFGKHEAAWTLESGHVRLMEPLSDGSVTGLVFEGRGRFRMAIPDPVEREQWRRAADRPEEDAIDETFTALVLRTSEALVSELFGTPGDGGFKPDKVAQDRHDNWLVQRFVDADARVIAALLSPGDAYLRVGMKTDELDWLTYDYDGRRQEEILLTRYDPGAAFSEDWVSLDRPEDRDGGGRPGRSRRPAIDLTHVDLEMDLTRAGKNARAGLNEIHPRRGSFVAELTFVPRVDGAQALALVLSPASKVTVVREGDRPLGFLRDHIGSRSSALDNRLYDDSLVVVLERPLVRGEERRLRIEYEREILNYASGRSWYPGERAALRDVHTARMTITARKKDDVRAMGELLEEREEEKTRTQVWDVARPVRIATFSFAERFEEETLEQDGIPAVISFSASHGPKARRKARSVAEDVAASLTYFQDLFQSPLGAERIYVTSVIGTHGQSFEGYIHLSELSFDLESEGPTELFRAHEVAHQWWGHEVMWAGYRDQWLSEAFAQYSAMMFLEEHLEKGKKYYDEIVRSYIGQMLGVVPPTRFNRFPLESNDRQRRRIGPISIGYRASMAWSRRGFVAQSYYKGALVLHMLRTLLRHRTGTDETFVEVLRDFVKNHRGDEASTRDFLATLRRRVPGEWDWFFDQWIHGTAIPTYTWRYRVTPNGNDAGERFQLRLEVEQSGVPEDFRMPVPIEVDGGEPIVVWVDEPKETLTVPLAEKPKKVAFNPGGAVLARVKKK